MGGLFYSLHIGLSSLRAQQLGIATAGNNVANVNTPGYSRQRVGMRELTGLQLTEGNLGGGVRVAEIGAARDRFIEGRLVLENQRLGQQETLNQHLRQVEAVFAETGGAGVRDTLSRFFNSFSDLANNPTNTALRQQVLSAGNNLANSVRTVHSQLSATQTQANQDIRGTVDRVNALTEQVAALNVRVANAEAIGQDAAGFRDQRQVLLGELGQLVNINYLEDEVHMVSVHIGGRSIVEKNKSTALTAAAVGGPNYAVSLNGVDIRSEITSGRLNGLFQVRDTYVPGYLQSLEAFASTLIAQVNAVHAGGTDLTGAGGGNFFTPTPAGASAAQTLSVAVTATDRIAAAAAGQPARSGDNTNARALAALATTRQAGLGSATFSDYYGSLVARVGGHAREAADGLRTQRQVVRQVQNQRDSVSGVSLDEEMASLIQFQKAYEASARYVSIVNSLTEETMRLLGR